MSRIPHLPDEIHLLVGQYVRRDDLASYRLASKLLLSIGTAELFGTLTFHYSTASLARLVSIGNCEHLRKHVKTIFWDVNLWRIPRVRDLNEWQGYFRYNAAFLRRWNCEEQACRLELLAQNREEWVAYLDKVDDEKAARKDQSLPNVLERFYNLHTIHVVHGELVPAHRGIKKVGDEVNSALVEPVILRRGQGMNDFNSQTGNEVFQSLPEITIPRLTKLKLDRIHYTNSASKLFSNLDSLKSLDIKITARADGLYGPVSGPYVECHRAAYLFSKGKLRHLQMYHVPQLECLKINLDCTNEKMTLPSRQPLAYIGDVLGTQSIWPRLRKLSLCHFYATPETLISLLTSHRETLRDLRLRNIVLDRRAEKMLSSSENDDSGNNPASLVINVEEYGWPQILQHVAGCLELQRATLSGQLATNRHQQSWDLDTNHEFAAAISNYLVRGGECPW